MGWEYRFQYRVDGGDESKDALSVEESKAVLDDIWDAADAKLKAPKDRTDVYWNHTPAVGVKERGAKRSLEVKVRQDRHSSVVGLEKWSKDEFHSTQPSVPNVVEILAEMKVGSPEEWPPESVTKVVIEKSRRKLKFCGLSHLDGEVTNFAAFYEGDESHKQHWVSVAIEGRKATIVAFLKKHPGLVSAKLPGRVNGGFPGFTCTIFE